MTGAYRFETPTRTGQENAYLSDLAKHESRYSQVEQFMNFSLYTPRQNLATFLVKYEIFKQVLEVQGSVVECGVLFGGGLMTFAQLSAILEPVNHQRRVIGFDTFAGFPSLSEADDASLSPEAKIDGLDVDAFEEISDCAALYDANRFVGHIPKVELVKGDARTTIPKYVRDHPQLIVSLLYLDFDVYEPTLAAITHLHHRMPRGAIIAFDELNSADWSGETKAVLDSLNIGRLEIKRCVFGSTISYAVL